MSKSVLMAAFRGAQRLKSPDAARLYRAASGGLMSKYSQRFKTGFAQCDTFACIGGLLYVDV